MMNRHLVTGIVSCVLMMAAGRQAGAATYYVRIGGSDANNGLTEEAANATIYGAVVDANAAAGYHTIDIGTGRFQHVSGQLPAPNKSMIFSGAGVGVTILDRTNLTATVYMFSFAAGMTLPTASTPLLFRNFTLANSSGLADSGKFINSIPVDYFQVDNVSLEAWQHVHYGLLRCESAGLKSNFTIKNFTFANTTSDSASYRWMMRMGGSTTKSRLSNWVWDSVTITNNPAVWGGTFDGSEPRWVADGWTLKNSTWSRNWSNGCYTLTTSSQPAANTQIRGTNLIDTCTIEDNFNFGVFAKSLDSGAGLTIKDSVIGDTAAGYTQAVGVIMSIQAFSKTVGVIRVVNTTFNHLEGTPGSAGIQINDWVDGTRQERPIELKDVTFNNSAVGLAILDYYNNPTNTLWYIDPDQSGAVINGGGTLVTGGRMTCYGDANMDGVVNLADTRAAGYPVRYPKLSGATWATGDFDADGDFDATDLAWLPMQTGAIIQVR